VGALVLLSTFLVLSFEEHFEQILLVLFRNTYAIISDFDSDTDVFVVVWDRELLHANCNARTFFAELNRVLD